MDRETTRPVLEAQKTINLIARTVAVQAPESSRLMQAVLILFVLSLRHMVPYAFIFIFDCTTDRHTHTHTHTHTHKKK
jgi:hypothetical protein